jgi:hypothetical protein
MSPSADAITVSEEVEDASSEVGSAGSVAPLGWTASIPKGGPICSSSEDSGVVSAGASGVVLKGVAEAGAASFLGRPRPRFAGCSDACSYLASSSLDFELGSEVVAQLVSGVDAEDAAGVYSGVDSMEDGELEAGCAGVEGAFGSEPKVIFVPRSSATISACASVTVSHVSLISIVIRPFLLQ